jgi:hypothetical protein
MARFAQVPGGQGGFNNALQNVPGGRPRVFRLGLAPDIVNPRINRLWLVPVWFRGASDVPPDFSAVQSEFYKLYAALGTRRLIIHGIVAPHRRYKPEQFLGSLTLGVDDGTHHIVLAPGTALPEQKTLQDIMSRAGALLPDDLRSEASKLNPTTPFAEWTAVVWKHSVLKPCTLFEIIPLDDKDKETAIAGLQWPDPIPASLFTIDSLGLAKRRLDDLKILDSEWSVPMSKTEFARRLFGRPSVRARDIDPIFDGYEKVQISNKKWVFRLDTLPAAARRKLEDQEQ